LNSSSDATVDFDALRFHSLFKGDEAPLLAMERAGLVAVSVNDHGSYLDLMLVAIVT
jgi:hypothetical protein